jgi:hypothetical protein
MKEKIENRINSTVIVNSIHSKPNDKKCNEQRDNYFTQ